MAKEKFTSDGDDNYQEYYPLVMDAPLSNIDIGFIPGVCNTLPKIAEQIIIFLNEKDSEIYTRYAADTIGRNYKLTTNGHLETKCNGGLTCLIENMPLQASMPIM
jgi:DNA sulfur modification protein DndD